jgi:hypothetical protein
MVLDGQIVTFDNPHRATVHRQTISRERSRGASLQCLGARPRTVTVLAMAPRTNTEEMGRVAGGLAECRAVYAFMNHSPVAAVCRHHSGYVHGGNVLASFLRGMYWVYTLAKLNHPADFQAASAGARALMEIVVDLSLLCTNKPEYLIGKLVAWEESAKLKQAQAMVRRHEQRPEFEVPQLYADFIAENEKYIRSERQRHWGDPDAPHKVAKHPNRWTGNGLDKDAEAVSADLHDYYIERHAALCWYTHGSGATGIRNVDADAFPGILAVALHDGADFGMRLARLAVEYLGAYDTIMANRFRQGDAERVQAHYKAHAQMVQGKHSKRRR